MSKEKLSKTVYENGEYFETNSISCMYEDFINECELKENTDHPALHTMPSALYGYDFAHSSVAYICLTTFCKGGHIVGVWEIYQGTMVRRYRFVMDNNPENTESPEETRERTMAIQCVEAIRDALKTGALIIKLIYRDFKALENLRLGLGPQLNIETFLLYNLIWAENYGVRFVFPSEGDGNHILLSRLEDSYKSEQI